MEKDMRKEFEELDEEKIFSLKDNFEIVFSKVHYNSKKIKYHLLNIHYIWKMIFHPN